MKRTSIGCLGVFLVTAACARDDRDLAALQRAVSGGSPIPAYGYPIGAVTGSDAVSNTGAFTYTVALPTPPGVRGMEPHLALTYNSQNGRGLAGVGFDVSGLSRIERCPRTMAQDGEIHGVGIDRDDAFCVDGLRLVQSSAGTYGWDGVEYMTEGQTWTRLRSQGDCSARVQLPGGFEGNLGGPCSFTSTLKNGTEVEYGAPACSMVFGGEAPPRVSWPMTRLRDPDGNTLTVEYASGGPHTCVPTKMKYTANATAGLAAQREVRFFYGNVATPLGYVGGLPRALQKRLERVETWLTGPGPTLVKKIQLGYDTAPKTGRPRVVEVEECNGQGGCFQPTSIDWTDHQVFAAQPTELPTNANTPFFDEHTLSGDFDGDGIVDFLQLGVFDDPPNPSAPSISYQWLSKGGCGQHVRTPVEWNAAQVNGYAWAPPRWHTGDFDGDGETDLLWLYQQVEGQIGWAIHAGGPEGLATAATWSQFGEDQTKPSLYEMSAVGDFDGDGRADVVGVFKGGSPPPPLQAEYGQLKLYRSTGTGFATPTYTPFASRPDLWPSDPDWSFTSQDLELALGDFNGDGRADVLALWEATGWRLLLSTGAGFQEAAAGRWPLRQRVIPADVNGDGNTDLVLIGETWPLNPGPNPPPPHLVQEGYVLLRSTGLGFEPLFTGGSYPLPAGNTTVPWGYTGKQFDWRSQIQVADFNGDGLDDLVGAWDRRWLSFQSPPPTVDGIGIYLSDGDSYTVDPTSGWINHDGEDPYLAADFRGNGLTSIFQSTGGFKVFWSTAIQGDLVREVTTGIGQVIDVTYAPMTCDIYTRGTGAVYPQKDLAATMPLVYAVGHDDGSPMSYIYDEQYYYGGARADSSGRGFLGFADVERIADGGTLVTHYLQDYPFTGFVSWQDRFTTSQDLLTSRAQFMYQDVVHPAAPGAVHNVQTEWEFLTEYDLSEQEAMTRAKSRVFDAFGNVLELHDHGDTGDAAELVVTTTYDNSITAAKWRVGFPLEMTTTDSTKPQPLARHKIVYDAKMHVLFEGKWDDVHAQWLGTKQAFDAFGQVTTSKSGILNGPDLGTTTFFYDAYRQLWKTVNPLGHVTTKTLDARFGNETERYDANGNKIQIVSDGFGRTFQIFGPAPWGGNYLIRQYVYTTPGYGIVAQELTPRTFGAPYPAGWDWTEQYYDGLGRETKTRKNGYDGQAIVVEREIDPIGRIARESRPRLEGDAPQWIEYDYDRNRRIAATTLPGGRVVKSEYDEASWTIERTDPNGSLTELELDDRGKLSRKVDPLGVGTDYQYDQAGRMEAVVTPVGPTTIQYDGLGHKVKIENQFTSQPSATQFVYDHFGQLVKETDANGRVIVRTYDALGRTRDKTYYASAAASDPDKTIRYGYDDPAVPNGKGQVTSIEATDGQGKPLWRYAFERYDAYGHQLVVSLEIDGHTFEWQTEYDPAGKPVRRVYPDGSESTIELDSAGHLLSVSLEENSVTTEYARFSEYDAEGRPGYIRYGNTVVTCLDYDPETRRLVRSRTAVPENGGEPDACPDTGGDELIHNEYQWDKVDNLSAIDDLLGDKDQTFSYNGRGELIQAVSANTYGTQTFSYDAFGNRVAKNFQPYVYDGDQVVSGPGFTAAYDAVGNMVSRTQGARTFTYAWDGDDQLTDVAVNDGSAVSETHYVYDHAGHRLKKVDPDGTVTYYAGAEYEVTYTIAGSTVNTKYVNGPMGRIAQITSSGTGLASLGPPSQDVGRGVALAAIPAALLLLLLGRLGRRRSRRSWSTSIALLLSVAYFLTHGLGQAYGLSAGAHGPGVPVKGIRYLHQDFLGSTVLVTDENAKEQARLDFEPWGKVWQPSSTGTDDFRPKYTGKEWDAGSELYDYGARPYDPELGRFLSADRSIGADPLRTVAENRYAYAANNPITYADPSGHFAWAVVIIVAILAVAAGIIYGTGGRIFTDPQHAFDDFDWSAAVFGALVVVAAAVVSYGLGALAVAAVGPTIAGINTTTLVTTSVVAGAISCSIDYLQGERDPGKLFASFGKGFAFGFLSGLVGGAVGSATDSEFLNQVLTTLARSGLKKLEHPDAPMSLQVWAFQITFDEDGNVGFDVDYAFLAGEALKLASTVVSLGKTPSPEQLDWKRISATVDAPEDGEGYSWMKDLFKTATTDLGAKAVYDLAGAVFNGVATFAAYRIGRELGLGSTATSALEGAARRGADKSWGAFGDFLEIEDL